MPAVRRSVRVFNKGHPELDEDNFDFLGREEPQPRAPSAASPPLLFKPSRSPSPAALLASAPSHTVTSPARKKSVSSPSAPRVRTSHTRKASKTPSLDKTLFQIRRSSDRLAVDFPVSNVRDAQPEAEEHIPRPPNAFICFRSYYWQTQKDASEERDHSKISAIVGKTWNAMTDEQKAPFRAQALERQREHRALYPDYKYQPAFKAKPSRKRVSSTPKRHPALACKPKRASKAKSPTKVKSPPKVKPRVRQVRASVVEKAKKVDVKEEEHGEKQAEEDNSMVDAEDLSKCVVKEEFHEPTFSAGFPSPSASLSFSTEHLTPANEDRYRSSTLTSEDLTHFGDLLLTPFLRSPTLSYGEDSPYVPTSEIPQLDLCATPKHALTPIEDHEQELYTGGTVLPPSYYDLGVQFGGFKGTVSSHDDSIWDNEVMGSDMPGLRVMNHPKFEAFIAGSSSASTSQVKIEVDEPSL